MTEPADALLEHATELHREGRNREAIVAFRQGLAVAPESPDSWYLLGYALKAEGEFEEALQAYAQALARGVEKPEEVHLNRAVIYADHLRRDENAEQELTAALMLAPTYVPALLNFGNLHEDRGERELALACYDRILALSAEAAGEHHDLRCEALARSVHLRPPSNVDDPIFRQLGDASSALVGQTHAIQASLQFAAGTAYDKLGAFDLAFEAFAKGNRTLMRQSGRTYDRERSARFIDALIEAFPSVDNGKEAAPTAKGASPLFICGMFRSGSTLVEQVLAGHPRVTAGGELDFLVRLAASGPLAPYPASMQVLDPERDARLADDYRAHLARLYPDTDASGYITDKRPDNFLLIGLIKRLFPAAKIIHTSRHPLDNGLSVFMQHLNPRVIGYSVDLGDIGHYYGQYRRLMAHWKALYPDDIYDFAYDAFIREPKPTLEPLFGFLGLDWDERCLEFHTLGNTIKTASYWQVRQPLYRDASGRWRNYRTQLHPLLQSLRDAGVNFDDAA